MTITTKWTTRPSRRHPTSAKLKAARARRARIARVIEGDRGVLGPGGGRAGLVQAPREYRATTVQVCGLYPFVVGAAAPMVGVPVGLSLIDGAPVCSDPISWFQDAKLIHNPSAFLLGRPGTGKSTLLRRMILGQAGFGVIPLVLGDVKGEHGDLITALGGQVIRLGRGRGYINVLDVSDAQPVAERLRACGYTKEAAEVTADACNRRALLVAGLIELARKGELEDRETAVLETALAMLDDRADTPVLADLVALIESRPAELALIALDRGDPARYQDVTENLVVTLRGLLGAGRLGEVFSKPTTVRMRRDVPVCFDISAINEHDSALMAAALLTCWTVGFGQVAISQVLAACGLEPLRHYQAVADELRLILDAGDFMVDRVDRATRLNRQLGFGLLMCTHTMSDLMACHTERARRKACGFVERAGYVICGGLPRREMEMLTDVVPMNQVEQDTLIGWQDPPATTRRLKRTTPPGQGHFLIKVGGRPGWPVKVVLSESELAVNDTNKLWHQHSTARKETRGGTRV